VKRVEPAPTQQGPAEWFTGDVYLNVHYRGEEPSRVRLNTVRFTPGARTAWHRHAVGQTLHCTDGLGYVVSRGEAGEQPTVLVLSPGETIHTPPGEWHWHGATPDRFMTHLAMWESPGPDDATTETEWGQHVTDAEYDSARRARAVEPFSGTHADIRGPGDA